MKKLLCPSMMCADFKNLINEVNKLQKSGCDIFHVDIMDGNFVPNFGMGLQDIECICKNSTIPVDVHLMITRPEQHIEKFAKIGVDIIYIHPETEYHPMRTLQYIKDLGCKPGIAIDPAMSVESVIPLLPLVDYVLVMSVNPGFAGQKYLDSVDVKIRKLAELKNTYNFTMIMDGSCSPEKIKACGNMGMDGFVLGTSALFGKGRPYIDIISELRQI